MRTIGLPLHENCAYSSRRRYGNPYIYLNMRTMKYAVVYNSKVPGFSRYVHDIDTYKEAESILNEWRK